LSASHPSDTNPFRQPRAVWAVAFAFVISFMGIGLVDPILPALSAKLRASPSQVELLFTSYLVVTAVAMLVTGHRLLDEAERAQAAEAGRTAEGPDRVEQGLAEELGSAS
jgi:hypothetical protein